MIIVINGGVFKNEVDTYMSEPHPLYSEERIKNCHFALENRKNSLPYGDIYIKNNHGYPQYYFHCNQEEKYLGKKDAGLISQLVQKEHIKIALKAARHEAEILKKDIIAYPRNTFEKVYETLPEERKKYADRLFFTFESADQPLDLSWLDEFIEKNFR